MIKSFESKNIKLEAKTVSERLRAARQKKGLSLAEAAKKTQVNLKYLEALEKGDLENLPYGAYGRNFLREYAFFLGLNYKTLIDDFEKEASVLGRGVKKEDYFSKPIIKKKFIFSFSRIFKNLLAVFVIIVLFIYLGAAVGNIFAPPFLVLESPQKDFVTQENNILIKGQSESEVQIIINGETIATQNGFFTKDINLKKGINIITIQAKKKHGAQKVIKRQILAE